MATLIVKSVVKKTAKGYRVSPEFYRALEKAVKELITCAMRRAKANGRKTLRAADL